jgi:hypothetical protein
LSTFITTTNLQAWREGLKKMVEDKPQPIYLSKADWVEIYYAVESKMKGVSNGEYGTGRSKKKWVKHLKSIMTAIGPDGEIAIERGVESLGDEDRVTFDDPTGWPDHGIELDRLIEKEG